MAWFYLYVGALPVVCNDDDDDVDDVVGALSVMTVDVETGREHLTAKTMSAFDHLYEHHRDEADWYLKASHSLTHSFDQKHNHLQKWLLLFTLFVWNDITSVAYIFTDY